MLLSISRHPNYHLRGKSQQRRAKQLFDLEIVDIPMRLDGDIKMEHIHGVDVSWMTHGNPKGCWTLQTPAPFAFSSCLVLLARPRNGRVELVVNGNRLSIVHVKRAALTDMDRSSRQSSKIRRCRSSTLLVTDFARHSPPNITSNIYASCPYTKQR